MPGKVVRPDVIRGVDREDGTTGLAGDSSARMAAELLAMFTGAAAAVITARWLGPDGKGILATITFLAGVLTTIATLGLGDAAIMLVGRRAVEPRAALEANLAAVIPAAALCGLILVMVVLVTLPADAHVWTVLVVVACLPLAGAVGNVYLQGLVMRQRIKLASAATAVSASVTLAGTFVLLVPLELGLPGAVAALLLAGVAGGATAIALLPGGRSLRPRWEGGYLSRGLRFGVRMQGSYLLATMAGRADIFLVLLLAGAASAGRYSVALTLASFVNLAALAIGFASFPRLAYASDAGATTLAADVTRPSLAAGVAVAVPILATLPLSLTLLFGDAFSGAIAAAAILTLGAIPLGGQWVLARCAAARGDARLVLLSFAASLGIMVSLDLALIPEFGLSGAAVASLVANTIGFAITAAYYHRLGLSFGQLVPKRSDFRAAMKWAADSARRTLGFCRKPLRGRRVS